MSFEPLIPASLWLALAIGAVALLAWYAMRRPAVMSRARWASVVGLMSAAVALVLLILLNPIHVRPIPPPPGRPLLTLLADASASMNTPDAGNGATRYEQACAIAREMSGQLGGRFDVRVRSFSGQTTAADAGDLAAHRPDGQTTDIAQAISDNLAEDRPQGQVVVLLSDGIQNVGNGVDPVFDSVRRARQLDVPVCTRTLGGAVGTIDLAVSLRSSQDLAFINQRVPVTAHVTQIGAKGVHANVSLLFDGKEVGRQDVLMTSDSADVQFWTTQEKVGLYPYEVRVDPLPREQTQANNSATYLLRVIDQPIKVLVLEGKPYWDSKFLIRTLASVPALDLESIVKIADGRFMDRTVTRHRGAASQPAEGGEDTWRVMTSAENALGDPAKLRQYQIVVLGRSSESFLSEAMLANLQNWVAHDGGSLVCYRGEPVAQVNQQLARMLPVKWTPSHESRFRIQLTDQGRNLHWFGGSATDEDNALAGLPTLASAASVDRSKPLAVVLATSVAPGGGESPAVVYQPYGTGRAVVIEGAGMWRWAFLPPQFQQRESVYSDLWHSLLRWLTSGSSLQPGQQMTLHSDKVTFATVEPATATVLVREEAAKTSSPEVELLAPTGGESKKFAAIPLGDQPGVFRVDFGKLPEGRFQARIIGNSQDIAMRTVFDVRAISQEQLDLAVRPDLMSRIASDSGGVVLGANPAEELAKHFEDHLQRSRPPRFERTTAWDRPWAILCVLAIWCFAWFVRRSGGLV